MVGCIGQGVAAKCLTPKFRFSSRDIIAGLLVRNSPSPSSTYLSLRPSTCISAAPTGRIYVNLILVRLCKSMEKFQNVLKSGLNTGDEERNKGV